MIDKFKEQLEREKEQHRSGYEKYVKAQEKQEKQNDGSNTDYARHWKKYLFSQILDGLQDEIGNPNLVRSSAASVAIKNCLGTQLVKKKDKETQEVKYVEAQQRNYFDLELSAFVTFQMLLDNALCETQNTKVIDGKTGKLRKCSGRRTKTQICDEVGKRVEQQLYFNYINELFPGYFKQLNDKCSGGGDQPRSSSYYWRYNVERELKDRKTYLRTMGRHLEADALDWRPFNAGERKQVGAWLIRGVIKYSGLFREEVIREAKSSQIFIVLTEDAQQHKQMYLKNHQPFIWEQLPMICVPVEATINNYGSWLSTVEQSSPDTYKGSFTPSQDHLDYVNRLQSVPYKINPFVAELMEVIHNKGLQLGKFIPHYYQEPASVGERLGYGYIQDYVQQTMMVKADPSYFDAKWTRKNEIISEIKRVEKGRLSRDVFQSMMKLKGYEELFYPTQWDFRGRVYSRCANSPDPQGSDFSKALLKFAEELPIDDRTEHYLAVEVANNAGMDKLTFEQRVAWTKRHLREIEHRWSVDAQPV